MQGQRVRRHNGFEPGKNVGMIRFQVYGDFGVPQKFFDIPPRHHQIEHVFSVVFFGSFDVSLQLFHFQFHAGIEIWLFNMFHGFELFPSFTQGNTTFFITLW